MKYIVFVLWFTAILGYSAETTQEKVALYDSLALTKALNILTINDNTFVLDQRQIPAVIDGETFNYQANSLIIKHNNEITVVDAPARLEDAEALILWMNKKFGGYKGRVINTHFHKDSVGSNTVFRKSGFKIFASTATKSLLEKNGDWSSLPTDLFPISREYDLPDSIEPIKIIYPGRSHSSDNVVVYFPNQRLMFGSCMVKTGRGLGNMGDADIQSWRMAISHLKQYAVDLVIPGHSLKFSPENIEHTAKLLDRALVESNQELGAPKLAITMDDFLVRDSPLLTADQKNNAILNALKKHKIKAALFVTSQNLDRPEMYKRLEKWDKAGHMISNHTKTHRNYHKVGFDEFSKEILYVESILKGYKNYQKYFRFPMLKAGDTVEKRDKMRAFLKKHDYKNGYVTIDTSDWYIESRLLQALKKNKKIDLEPYKAYYLDHVWENANYYDGLVTRILGRKIKHTLLTHHNLLNALFLDDLIAMFKAKGWQVIDVEEAFKDPIYKMQPDVLPAGESIVWSLAKENAKFSEETRYPAESARYEKPKMDVLRL